jgi:uncharacterized protein YndB with AHSA1/START domain
MEKVIQVTRVFAATPEQVWKTWTEAELVKRWWGPDIFTCPLARMDVREGGISLVAMRAPQQMGGADIFSIWAYKKVVPHQRLEFIQNLADANGNKMDPSALGMPPDFPEDILTVVVLKDLGNGSTEITVTEHADMGQMTKFAQMGLEQSIDKMGKIFTPAG